MSYWINKKKRTLYQVQTIDAINCTNEQDGQRMVVYTDGKLTFVRERDEFLLKFSREDLFDIKNYPRFSLTIKNFLKSSSTDVFKDIASFIYDTQSPTTYQVATAKQYSFLIAKKHFPPDLD